MRQLEAPGGVPIFVGEKGSSVIDVDGKSYVDGFAGLMYKNIGYGRKELAEAAYKQLLEFSSPPGQGGTVPAIKLAAKLAEITPGSLGKSFLTTGGAEAIEVAVKLSKQYQRNAGFPNRYKIIARTGEYHGGSHLTMQLGKHSGQAWLPYEPLVPGVRHVPQPYCYRCPIHLQYPDCGVACAKELDRVIEFEGPEMVAAFIMTGVCQSTPVMKPPPEYAPMVREICDKHGVLLIDDEVVSGFGRTGKMFAIEHWGVVPDMMTVAKGIISGYLPLGACISKMEMAEKFEGQQAFRHIITYGGMPACCAAGLANIDILEKEKLVERAAEMGEYFEKKAAQLYQHRTVGDIRGMGLMWGVELVKNKETKEKLARDDDRKIMESLNKGGLLTTCGNGVIRFLPPLVITESEIDQSINAIEAAVTEFEKGLSAG
jgi:adenosylmethionine-8-amino-7-oxononanoate aminotransferase